MWTYERSMDYYLITSLFFCQPLFKEQKQNSSGFFAVRHKRKQLTNRLPRCIITKHLRECWNGRQARLRCVWLRRVGSSPISRTRKSPEPMARGFFWCEGRTRMAQATFSCCFAAIHLEGGERSEVKKCPGDTFLARGRVPGNRMEIPKDRQAISGIRYSPFRCNPQQIGIGSRSLAGANHDSPEEHADHAGDS